MQRYFITLLLLFASCFSSSMVASCTGCALQTKEYDILRKVVFSECYFDETMCGVISATQYFEARQDYAIPIPGFIIIASKRHIQSIDELSEEERNDLIEFIFQLRSAMREKLNITTVYIIQEEESKHFHVWLFPRYDWMEPFGKKISSVKPIMNWAREHLNTETTIATIKNVIKTLKSQNYGESL